MVWVPVPRALPCVCIVGPPAWGSGFLSLGSCALLGGPFPTKHGQLGLGRPARVQFPDALALGAA